MAQIVKMVDADKKYRPWHDEGYYVNPSARVLALEYNGKSIVDLLEEKENYTLAHAKEIIVNEGGYVDDDGIIHKGNAKLPISHIEDNSASVEDKEYGRTHIHKVHIPWGLGLGKAYLGKTVAECYLGEEVTKINALREEHEKNPLTVKDIAKAMGKYNYYISKQGVIKYIFGRVPTKDEDKYHVYEWITKQPVVEPSHIPPSKDEVEYIKQVNKVFN